jgi:hypothetical protein
MMHDNGASKKCDVKCEIVTWRPCGFWFNFRFDGDRRCNWNPEYEIWYRDKLQNIVQHVYDLL